MATSLACRLGLPCRVDTLPGRGIVPGASDAPRHRSVRAHATSSKGAGEAGDDVRNVRLGSKNNNNHVLSHDPTPSVVPLRAGSAAPPADEWIRVVVDSVHLDDAPFEHREARNFRSAGGEAHQTVRVLTALLRTVTDGKDLLLPLVASALVSDPLADSLAGRVTKVKDGDFDRDRSDVQPQPLDANDEETMDDTSHGYRRHISSSLRRAACTRQPACRHSNQMRCLTQKNSTSPQLLANAIPPISGHPAHFPYV